TRRQLGRLALGSIPALAAAGSKIDSTIQGVRIGASGYSFAALKLDDALQAMRQIGLGVGEVWYRHIEPKLPRQELRAWRISAPLNIFQNVAKKYDDAGIDIVAFTFDMKEDFTDKELDRGFQMAHALGTNRIATSTTFSVVPRILPLMEKYKIEV